jgi:hypothetical protein
MYIQPRETRQRTLARLSVLIRLLLPTLVGEANDADGEALRRARFVRLEEAEQCRGRARCRVRTLMRTRRAEWERRSCVAEVFESCLGVLTWHQVYSTLQ